MLAGALIAISAAPASASAHARKGTGCAPLQSRVRAYGYVTGRAGIRAIPALACGKGVQIKQMYNAALARPRAGSPAGTYCIALRHPAVTSVEPVVVVGTVGLPVPEAGPPSLPYASWIHGAADCGSGQVEVRTFSYRVGSGSATLEPSDAVSFSFVVL
jgi:hypothetical protein